MIAAGVTALAVTKAGDVATTVVGLRAVEGLRERNPVAAAVMAELGTLPGLVVLGAATVLLIAAVVEVCVPLAGRLEDGEDFDTTSGRLACYGVGCLFNLGVTVYNASLIAGTALLG